MSQIQPLLAAVAVVNGLMGSEALAYGTRSATARSL
jgi:hypothetical protein